VVQQVSKVVPVAPDTLKTREFFTFRWRTTGNECRSLTPIVHNMRCKPDPEASSKADEKTCPEHNTTPVRTACNDVHDVALW